MFVKKYQYQTHLLVNYLSFSHSSVAKFVHLHYSCSSEEKTSLCVVILGLKQYIDLTYKFSRCYQQVLCLFHLFLWTKMQYECILTYLTTYLIRICSRQRYVSTTYQRDKRILALQAFTFYHQSKKTRLKKLSVSKVSQIFLV